MPVTITGDCLEVRILTILKYTSKIVSETQVNRKISVKLLLIIYMNNFQRDNNLSYLSIY